MSLQLQTQIAFKGNPAKDTEQLIKIIRKKPKVDEKVFDVFHKTKFPKKLPDRIKNTAIIDTTKEIDSSFLNKSWNTLKNCSVIIKNSINSIKNTIDNFIKPIKQFFSEIDKPKKSVKCATQVSAKTIKKSRQLLQKRIKTYMDSLKTGQSPDPVEIEKIMKSLNAEVEEVYFKPSAKISFGRKKIFTLNGEKYVLEVHRQEFSDSNLSPVLRFYNETNKDARNYLTKNGTFKQGSYHDGFTHLETSFQGQSWMEKADRSLKDAA